MASSQVEIAASASFGCILRDQNRGDRFTNTFQRSLKDYLLQTCISNSPPDENSLNSGSWVRNPNNNENNSSSEVGSPNSKRNARVLERWAKARNMVASIDGPNHERSENSPTQLDSSVKITNPGGVSSLVQRWKGFTETPQIQNPKGNNGHNAAASSLVSTPRSNSENVPPPNDVEHEGNTTNSLGSFVQSKRSEAFDKSADKRFDTPSMMTEDSFIDWESVQGGQDSADGGERERLRVADVIRKLTSENQMQGCLVSWKNEQGTSISSPSASPHPCELPLPQLRTAVSDQTGEQRGSFLSSSPVVSSPRLRGRQAFNDLLMQMERDRHRELDGLVERRAVSKFSHRGRIQSLLRLRFLRREAEARNDNHRQSLRREAPIGAQQQHSHGMEVRPQEISCLGGDANDEINLCRERVGAQQRFGGLEEATVGPWQHSISAVTRFQQHSFSKEVRDLETAQGEAAVEVRQQSHGTVLEGSRTRQPSAVVLLREKFNIRVENDASNPKTPRGVVVNSNAEVKNSSSSNQAMEEPQPHDQNLESCSMEDIHKEASPSLDTLRQGTSDEVCNIDSKESDAAPLTASNGWEEDVSAEEQESSNPEQTTTNEDMINCDWQEQESDDQQLVGIDHDWISDAFSRPWSEWDEQEANDEQNIETNNDWITDISRPRSDWEVLREVRYKEMLDPYLDNGDIRQLLERRSVSTFLSSNLRETMDQLMISRAERFPQSTGNEQEEEDGFRNRLEQLMLSRTQRQANKGSNHQEDGGRNMEEHQEDEEQDVEEDQEDEEEQDNDDDHEDEDEEQEEEDDDEESPITCQRSEVGDNVDQVADGVRTWSHDGDHEVSDDSDEVASQQSQSCQATYRGSQFCSFTNHSSIEMELIYDLRRHMVELQHEMSKLRKSLKSCVNMQSKLQRSIKHEVADAVSLSVRRVGKESLNGVPRKRSCVVCYEMQVDSLLYRCGHMCTCFKCAHELQWSSGKCPICRAPIVDVVRAYANDS